MSYLGLSGQDTVGLAQPFPQLADGLVCLFLSCAEDEKVGKAESQMGTASYIYRQP